MYICESDSLLVGSSLYSGGANNIKAKLKLINYLSVKFNLSIYGNGTIFN